MRGEFSSCDKALLRNAPMREVMENKKHIQLFLMTNGAASNGHDY